MTNAEESFFENHKKLCKAISNNNSSQSSMVRKPSVKITSNKQFLGIFIARVFIPCFSIFLRKSFHFQTGRSKKKWIPPSSTLPLRLTAVIIIIFF